MHSPISVQSGNPRAGWQARVEESGLTWHGSGKVPYWVEDHHVAFTLKAAEVLENAANEVHQLCLQACHEIIKRDWWERLAIPEKAIPQVMSSWAASDVSLYGRFDFAWDGKGSPKVLEYNADTPTSLLEASVIQWQWLEETHPDCDQLNSLHEALVERWSLLEENFIHFACAWENHEDRQTIAYLAETAEQAGKSVELMDISEIGFSENGQFLDSSDQPIQKLFKLYPWEWMADEPFFEVIGQDRSRFIEPAWKMMLSNKGILPILWELNPGHPLLLPAATSRDSILRMGIDDWVEKPFFGREGAGVTIVQRGNTLEKSNPASSYGPSVFQKRANLFKSGSQHFVWGLWMIGDECCGLSARADHSMITGNLSRFFPHIILP